MTDIEQEIVAIFDAGASAPACLATLIRASGSVPMSRRARMLVRADGSLAGTVGGGCLEAEVHRLGLAVIADGRPRSLRYRLDEEMAMATGMVCGGSVEIFLQPVGPEMAAVARAVQALRAAGERGVLATVVALGAEARGRAGAQLLLRADGSQVGGLGDAAGLDAAVAAEAPRLIQGEMPVVATFVPGAGLEPETRRSDEIAPRATRLFLDPIAPVPTLYLFGGGHVGIAVAQIAAGVGMRLVAIDDRAEFANRERFPQADEVLVADYDRVFDHLALDESAYVVIVTRGHKHDETVVAGALRTPARYIGMIGSRRKVKLLFDALRERGCTDADLARVHAPIGLEIGADTPEEIAVSILAEVIAVRRGVRQ